MSKDKVASLSGGNRRCKYPNLGTGRIIGLVAREVGSLFHVHCCLLATAVLTFGAAFPVPAGADMLSGKVIGISDGDTLTMLSDKHPIKIRLANIDAPEKSQPFGNRARQALSDMAFGKETNCERSGLDRYGRSIATCMVGNQDLNAAMLRLGMAWVYRKYATDVAEYYQLEEDARIRKVGLWAEQASIPPWNWRKQQKRTWSMNGQRN